MTTEDAPDLSQALAEPLRVRQILVNLVGNAIEFTERGWVTIAITAGAREVAMAVRDTGIRLAQVALGYIFDEFRQADGARLAYAAHTRAVSSAGCLKFGQDGSP